MSFEKIYNFRCPRWEDLPDRPIFNKNVVVFINNALEPILDSEHKLTTTMIQNYSKWKFIPKITGRKYERIHIAYLIVICIYKQILNIKEVNEGVRLMLNRMDPQEAYDSFAEYLERAIHRTFSNVEADGYEFKGFTSNTDIVGTKLIAHSFALKLLGETVIKNGGYENLGDVNE